jgi:hypothetical protein
MPRAALILLTHLTGVQMQFHKRVVPFLAASVIAMIGTALPAHAAASHSHAKSANSDSYVRTDAALRDLWVGHAFWVRGVAAETIAGNAAAASAAEKEAVANARQIAAAMEPYYGKAASEKLFALLAGHYTAVKHYLDAMVAGNTPTQDQAREAMGANAEQIAQFLSAANPHLPIDGVRGMLLAHGGHHVLQIQQLHGKRYGDEAKTWEEMKNHMYAVADAVTDALAKQFPAKFK